MQNIGNLQVNIDSATYLGFKPAILVFVHGGHLDKGLLENHDPCNAANQMSCVTKIDYF